LNRACCHWYLGLPWGRAGHRGAEMEGGPRLSSAVGDGDDETVARAHWLAKAAVDSGRGRGCGDGAEDAIAALDQWSLPQKEETLVRKGTFTCVLTTEDAFESLGTPAFFLDSVGTQMLSPKVDASLARPCVVASKMRSLALEAGLGHWLETTPPSLDSRSTVARYLAAAAAGFGSADAPPAPARRFVPMVLITLVVIFVVLVLVVVLLVLVLLLLGVIGDLRRRPSAPRCAPLISRLEG